MSFQVYMHIVWIGHRTGIGKCHKKKDTQCLHFCGHQQ